MAAIIRSFVDGRFGQIHLRTAKPNSPRYTPLVCLHHSPQSGRVFTEVLKDLGDERCVYAPDTPGFGDSDPPPEVPNIADYAGAIGDLLDRLGHGAVDLLGYHTGSAIAVELALMRPRHIRRLVLIGIPVFQAPEIEAFMAQPWPMPLTADASYVESEWARSIKWSAPGTPLDVVARGFVDKLKAGQRAFWGGRAAMLYPMAAQLAEVEQPILAISPRDDLWDISPRCADLIKTGTFEAWPEVGFGIFDVATARINARIRSHLNG